jgi:hypothetical protein
VRPRQFSSRRYIRHKPCTMLRQDYDYLQTDSNKLPLEPHHLGVSSGVSKTISEPMVRSAQAVHLYCINTNNISKWTKTRFHMTHSPRSSIWCVQDDFRAYGTFDTNRAPILSQDRHYLQTNSGKLPHDSHHLGVPLGASKMIFEPTVRSAQATHLVKISTISKRTKPSFHLSLVT